LQPMDGTGFLNGPRQEHHDSRCHPEQEQNVRWPGRSSRQVGNVLIISLENLRSRGDRESAAKKHPELAQIPGGVLRHIKCTESSPQNYGTLQDIGYKKTRRRRTNSAKASEENRSQQSRDGEGEPGKPARG
jgi:hypothetical protein